MDEHEQPSGHYLPESEREIRKLRRKIERRDRALLAMAVAIVVLLVILLAD